MGRIEWLKWIIHHGRKTRAKQIGTVFAFEVYYQFCKLRGYKVDHILEEKFLPAGKYILLKPRLPLSVRLLNRIFPFGKDAHAKYIRYTPEIAEEMKKAGRHVEGIEISYELRVNDGD
jgi:hypothetical protein